MFKKLKNYAFWKKGSGEMIGFICIAPPILALICCIIATCQISIINQKLSHCVYNACRSAVVSETHSIGDARAQELYAATMGTDNADEFGYEPCEVEILDGAEWEKGSYVRCTVRYHIQTLMPFTSGVREQSIVMMIENGDAG